MTELQRSLEDFAQTERKRLAGLLDLLAFLQQAMSQLPLGIPY
jgi:hypothetical protein